jgi:heme/copper-type cytochrome/quinol oxidase subunit 4
MKNIIEKLKTKWVVLVSLILIIFFIQDLVNLIHWVDFDNTTDKSLSYQLGVKSRLILNPILVTTIMYLIIFKFETKQAKSN